MNSRPFSPVDSVSLREPCWSAALTGPARVGGGALTSQWSPPLLIGPFRSVSLKQGLARGNSWHKFMDGEAVGEKGERRRRRGVKGSSPLIPLFFSSLSDNPNTLTLGRSLWATLWPTAGIERKKLQQWMR